MKNLIRRMLAMPHLDDLQRELEVEALSEDDCAYLVTYFADEFKAEFDVALLNLAGFRNEIGEAA